jgi:hypothetical protein
MHNLVSDLNSFLTTTHKVSNLWISISADKFSHKFLS